MADGATEDAAGMPVLHVARLPQLGIARPVINSSSAYDSRLSAPLGATNVWHRLVTL